MKVNKDFFEHLLNCLANQRFINDINADALEDDYVEVQKEMQEEIDKTYLKARKLLHDDPDPF